MKKLILALVVTLSPFLAQSYPAQSELFGLNKSMIQLWVSYEKGVTGTGSGVVIKKNHVATDCHVFQNATGVNVISTTIPTARLVFMLIGSMIYVY